MANKYRYDVLNAHAAFLQFLVFLLAGIHRGWCHQHGQQQG